MERTRNAVVVPAAFGWRDLGAWDAVLKESDRDGDGNRLNGDVLAQGVTNGLIHVRARLVAAVGLEGVVVVETADAVLVAGMDRVADVGGLVADMTRAGRPETGLHTEVGRSWGVYERLGQGEGFQVKSLRLDPGASISLQVHRHRAEHWVVVRGVAEVTRDERTFALRKNESAWIPTGARHRLHNPGTDVLEVIEVQVGDYLGEDDIVRFEDPQLGTGASTCSGAGGAGRAGGVRRGARIGGERLRLHRTGALRRRFVEKPGAETAGALIASGRFLWNSGMFLFDAVACRDAVDTHCPALGRIVRDAAESWNAGFLGPGAGYARAPAGSFDVLVMERTDRAFVVPATFAWTHLGSWRAVHEAGPKDARGTRLVGDAVLMDVEDSLILAGLRQGRQPRGYLRVTYRGIRAGR